MWIFNSIRNLLLSFIAVVVLIAIAVWLYLNIQASMQVSAQNAQIQLSDSLPTKIHVGNFLEAQAKGSVNTELNLDRELNLPLQGKYLAGLVFEVTAPVQVDIDYETQIQIQTVMPLDTTTDLIYQNKLLPKFPLKVDIPVTLSVPFKLKRSYQVPIQIMFNDNVYFEFDEAINLYVKHKLKPVLKINDPITMKNIAVFNATMYNTQRQSLADLQMNINLPVKNIHP